MANLTPGTPAWLGIYKKETTDPVLGGASNAIANLAELGLLDRTNYLADTEEIIRKIAGFGPVNRVIAGPEDASGNPSLVTVSDAAGTDYSLAVGAYACFAMGQEDISRDHDAGAVATSHAKNQVVKTVSVPDVTISTDGLYYFMLHWNGSALDFVVINAADVAVGPVRPAANTRDQFHYDTNEMRGYYSPNTSVWTENALLIGYVDYESGANITPHLYDYNTEFYSRDTPTGTIIQSAVNSARNIQGGYLYCDGATLNRADYPQLFRVIGTAFGSTSGTDFNLPTIPNTAAGSGLLYHYIKY